MNKLIIALSVACASAYVFADVGATPRTTKTDWFNATAGNAIEGGKFTPSEIEVKDGKYVIDSEPTEPVTFEANEFTGSAKDMVEVEIKLDTAIVPSDARGDLSDKNAKVAFAASEDNDVRAYYAWVGGDWTILSEKVPSDVDGTPYTLLVTFDNREATKKVQFKVDGTVLKDASGNEWLAYSPVVSTTMSIDLVGSGNVAFLVGKQVTVTAEVIDVDGGTIDIKEEDMAAFKNAMPERYTTVDAFVAAPASEAFGDKFKTTGITVGAAYALGLVEKATDADGEKMIPKDDGELKAHAIAESTAEGIKIGLNVTPRTDTGATITFNVVDTTATEESVVKTVSAGNDIVIPTTALGTGLKKFTVRAVVTPAAK